MKCRQRIKGLQGTVSRKSEQANTYQGLNLLCKACCYINFAQANIPKPLAA